MAVSGVRARNFIRGGTASSIFAARRGMSAARPARAAAPAGETAKFGKTTGQDFVKFVSGDKNTKAIRSAVNNLKNMLVEGFMLLNPYKHRLEILLVNLKVQVAVEVAEELVYLEFLLQ